MAYFAGAARPASIGNPVVEVRRRAHADLLTERHQLQRQRGVHSRAAVIRELEEDYVVFARSRGLGARKVLGIVLRNAAVPIVTSLGLLVAYLFGGTVLVETTFALPGLGSLLESSVLFKDFPVVQALTALVALVIAMTTLAVDLAYLAIDPRMRARVVRSR